MRDLTLVLLFMFLAGWSVLTEAKAKSDHAILLSKVKTLTLHGDKKTSHRRVSAIPQLTCIGGNGCKHFNVDVMRCKNAGSEYDAEDIQWTCSAELPSEFKLGSTEVVCEGYDNADDPWVLKGSCGAEYRLLLTDEGERKYAQKPPRYGSKQNEYSTREEDSESPPSSLAQFLFWLVFVGIICLILYRILYPSDNNGPVRLGGDNRPRWGGGGGGGGSGDNDPFDDPPPPYSPRPKSSTSRTPRTQSGPGFWTGAATGGAAGYGAGYYHGSRASEAERRQRERDRERSRERERERQRAPTSSWFGSGGSSPAPSSSRHESTGFGGTRRR